MARWSESIVISVKDIPDVVAALEKAKALEARHAALVAAARVMLKHHDEMAGDGGMDPLACWEGDALRAALDGEPA